MSTQMLSQEHGEVREHRRRDTLSQNIRTTPAGSFEAPDAEALRNHAWDAGERRPADSFVPRTSHVGLAMVSPCRGYVHWRMQDDWILVVAQERGDDWYDCSMVLRLYDVSYLEFNGLNANRIQDHPLPATSGQYFFDLSHCGTWQIAEVGFLLRNGEFIPAARSIVVSFADASPSPHSDHAAMLVDEKGNIEEIGSIWDQEKLLIERRTPKLRSALRVAAFAFASPEPDRRGLPDKFVSELAAGLSERGHDVRVFLATSDQSAESRQEGAVRYETLDVALGGSPLEQARRFSTAAQQRLKDLQPFDLVHLHDWMTAAGSWFERRSTVLSLSSIEATRRNGSPPSAESLAIAKMERDVSANCDCILTPDWLREKTLGAFGMDAGRVHAFPMEGRLPNEWEYPLDYGQVKREIGFGPLDRMMLFIGPLEHSAGGDLIIEALPVLMQRWPNLRIAFAGNGNQYGRLEHRAGEIGLAYAVRLLGDVEREHLTRLLRSSEALVLPSRYRVPFDDAVVDLARRAGRPVITTHGGPTHVVTHEETGIVTYDNPGSIIWAMDRVLGDPDHARRMGERGRCNDGFVLNWNDVARRYLELCASCFPQLTDLRV